jgi:phospholipase/lecithinase/hemolysin
VSEQVGQYLKGHKPAANDLMVLIAGANDFKGGKPLLSADTLASSLETLFSAGARQFVVPNLPAGGMLPFILGGGNPNLIKAANKFSADFDAELAVDVAAFQSEHTNATVVSVDVAGLFQ